MELEQLRRKFVEFFESNSYVVQQPSNLVPENDPTVLFTTAGMQQFKEHFIGTHEAKNQRIVTVQPVIRTTDISEVGDATHLTMFEMLGNFRFGEKSSMKMKQSAIREAWEFIHKVLEVDKSRVTATIFKGDKLSRADTEAEGIWRSLGVEVRRSGREDNFWGPTGVEGPCGPTSEIYIDGIEVWNLVFNQYYQDQTGKFSELANYGLDTGSGLERLAATLQQKPSVWEIQPFKGWIYLIDPTYPLESKIIIDHLRALIFLISAGITPGNKGRDYVLRRIIRKSVFLARDLELDWEKIFGTIRENYTLYKLSSVTEIVEVFNKERELFTKNLARATNYLERWIEHEGRDTSGKAVTELAFYMFESFGFPKELVIEYLVSQGLGVDPKYFDELFVQHQEVSREGATAKFKGGLADHEPQTIKHHTAHHLLLAALRQVLGDKVVQKGSNVTAERLRLDFNFDRKLTEEEIEKVEKIVNAKIKEDLPVISKEMTKDEALKSGALAEFGQKYDDKVTVYSIGDFSKELCGGPHVRRTGELGKFKILKEEASSQGVRRTKAKIT